MERRAVEAPTEKEQRQCKDQERKAERSVAKSIKAKEVRLQENGKGERPKALRKGSQDFVEQEDKSSQKHQKKKTSDSEAL